VIEKVDSSCERTAKGMNFFGGKVVSTHAEVDNLDPDSFYLLNKLRRHNWGEKFLVANAMAVTMGLGSQKASGGAGKAGGGRQNQSRERSSYRSSSALQLGLRESGGEECSLL
jgi:hypothetical protein